MPPYDEYDGPRQELTVLQLPTLFLDLWSTIVPWYQLHNFLQFFIHIIHNILCVFCTTVPGTMVQLFVILYSYYSLCFVHFLQSGIERVNTCTGPEPDLSPSSSRSILINDVSPYKETDLPNLSQIVESLAYLFKYARTRRTGDGVGARIFGLERSCAGKHIKLRRCRGCSIPRRNVVVKFRSLIKHSKHTRH